MRLAREMCKRVMLLACGALLVAGCSSGGGGGDDVDDLQITTQNAGSVAAAAFDAQEGLGGAAAFTGDTGVFSVAPAAASAGLTARVAGLLDRYVLRESRIKRAAVPQACADDGTFDILVTDAPPQNELGPGDSFTLVFDNCTELGEIIDGSITLTFGAISGDPSDDAQNWSVSITVTFDDLTVTGDGNSFIDGSFTFALSWNAATMTTAATLTGSNLTLTENGETVNVTGNFTFSLSIDQTTGGYTVNVSMSAVINGGRVTIGTETPLTGTGDADPDGGVLVVTGAGGSSITLTFTGAGNVTVDVDTNGDDATDCTQFLTVDTLDQFDPALCP